MTRIDITHGFRMYQSLLYSFSSYFENLTGGKLQLEKVYYATYFREINESIYIDLEQLIFLQQEISQIKILLRNLDISPFYGFLARTIVIVKDEIESLKKIMFRFSVGDVSDNLYNELNRIKNIIKGTKLPQINELTGRDKFYTTTILNGILPELLEIEEKIFQYHQQTTLWKRQLNLAKLLLERKMDFPTSLQLIRESFISWLCSDVLGLDAFNFNVRKNKEEIYKDIYPRIKNKPVTSPLLNIIIDVFKKRNEFSHAFTSKDQYKDLIIISDSMEHRQIEILEWINRLEKLYLDEDVLNKFKSYF